MKKINLILLSFILMVSAFYSCNKNNNPIPEPANNGSTYTADEMALWRQLNNFNQKIKTGLKSEEFISPDSAMWYLEALFNMQQATDTTYNELQSYERTYSFNVNTNGTVNMSEVVNVYNQLVTDLGYELDQIDSDFKFLIIADLEQESLKSGSFTMSLTAGMGINPLALYEPFTSVDNWYYGNVLGRLDGAYLWQSDAGIELVRRFNNPYIAYPFPHNSWINVAPPITVAEADFHGRIFYREATSAPCLLYTEMQYYLAQGHYIIYNLPGATPSGVRISGLYFKAMELYTNLEPPADHKYWHKYTIWYGTPVNIPPIE